MFPLLCIPFFIVCFIHFYGCLANKTKLANITKILLMPLLALAVAVTYFIHPFSITFGAEETVLSVVLYVLSALIAGTFGDYYLIRPISKQKFLKGVFAFFLGHAFYLLILVPRSHFWLLPAYIVIPFVVAYGWIVFALYHFLKKPKGLRGFAAVVYAFMLLLINFTCISAILVQWRSSGSIKAVPPDLWLTLAGNLIFLASDSLLAVTMFKTDFKNSKFAVMLTYCAAQFLLVYGILS